jgi:hypothetical protein
LLPDLVVLWRNHRPVKQASSSHFGTIGAPLSTGRTGNHRALGFLVVPPSIMRTGMALPQRVSGLAQFVGDVLPLLSGRA